MLCFQQVGLGRGFWSPNTVLRMWLHKRNESRRNLETKIQRIRPSLGCLCGHFMGVMPWGRQGWSKTRNRGETFGCPDRRMSNSELNWGLLT